MTEYAVPLGEAGDLQLLGGKGAGLTALVAAGFPVPDGFVITTDAYRDFIDAAGLGDAVPDRLFTAIPATAMPESIASQILDAYKDLGAPAVAVRSSGTAEDLAGASFAGQHDSYLGISGGGAVLDAVRDCWASLWTPRAVAYRDRLADGDRLDWGERELALAVVVQRMVDAEWAGVMFTADPISGRRDRIVLESVRGLGDALVSGAAQGRHAEFDKTSGRIANGGLDMPRQSANELLALGREVEKCFGGPQDIEWTYANGHCALVQSRPLTALPEEPTDSGRRSKRVPKGLGNFGVTADHMPFPPFPMDLSLIFRPVFQALLGAADAAGLSTPPVAQVLVEIADGVVQIRPPRIRPRWQAIWRVPTVTPALIGLLRVTTDTWRARSDDTLLPLVRSLDATDLSGLSDRELLDRVRELISVVGRLMPSRFGALMRGMLAEQIVTLLLRASFGERRAADLGAGLMSDVPCTLTAANADLERIAMKVRGTSTLRETYLAEEPPKIASRLRTSASGRALLADVDTHLQRFGFRALSIFTVGLPPLRDTPWVVHGFIKSLARRQPEPGSSARDRFEHAQAELVSAPGTRARLLRPLIARELAVARDGAGFRDDSQYALEATLAVARRILLEFGRRLVDSGVLTDADDIFYLEFDEIETPAQREPGLRAVVESRKAARASSLDDYTVLPSELFNPSADGRVQGMPASRGRIVGRVRVVHDETEFATLQPGEIMVCPFTNPTWTPLFSLAAAVVVDSGGAASHAAIVAREVGIPAIMGTGNGTRLLSDGQRVLVDATQGVVVPIG